MISMYAMADLQRDKNLHKYYIKASLSYFTDG